MTEHSEPSRAATAVGAGHVTIRPSILYVGTPVMLIASQNPDGTTNHAPRIGVGQMLVICLRTAGRPSTTSSPYRS